MTKKEIKKNLIVSSNDLVHAKYDLSLWQKRVFIYAISLLDKDSNEFAPIRMNIYDIIKFFKGSKGMKSYQAIYEAPKYLDKTIEIPYVTETGDLRYGFVKLLQHYTIPGNDSQNNQYIEIEFNRHLKPHLLDLKEKFLKYDIQNVIDLQSVYSFRMFEILKSYEYKKDVELEVEYLRDILEANNIYTAYKDFKKYIIDKAQADLSNFCDISFTYNEIKGSKGKKITSLVFHIHKNKKNNLVFMDIEANTEIKNRQEIDILSHDIISKNPQVDKLAVELSPIVVEQFGVSIKMLVALIEQYTEEDIRKAIKTTEKNLKAGKIENIAGFFVEAVRNSYKPAGEVQQEAKLKKAKLESERKSQLKSFTQELEELKKDYESDKNLVISEITQKEKDATSSIFEYLQMTQPMFFKGKTLDDCRENPMLRAIFKSEFENKYPLYFTTVKAQFEPKIKYLEKNIEKLKR